MPVKIILCSSVIYFFFLLIVCLPESATGNELGGGAATLIPTETVTPDPPPILVSLVPVPVEKPPVLPQPLEDVKIQREKVTVETPSPEVTSTTSPSPAGGVVEELLEEMVVQDSIITIDQHEVCTPLTRIITRYVWPLSDYL